MPSPDPAHPSIDSHAADAPLRIVDFAPTDTLLRDDVNALGVLVGEILAEQRGPAFLAEVERVRQAAIRRRESAAPVAELADTLAGVEFAHAADLVRAFASYFQAVNLAERVHRIRRRREHERSRDGAQPGGLRDVVARLAAEGVSAAEVAELLPRLRIEPVFTAHPTEAVRRALLEKERLIVSCLVADIDRGRTPGERRADRERIRLALTASWQTAEAPPVKPSVADEFEHISFYLSDVLYRVLPVFHEVFEEALRDNYGEDAPVLPAMLGFGTWVGGDMDGNPNVGADTIAATLSGQRALVLGAYRSDLGALSELLSQSVSRIGVSPELLARIEQYSVLMPRAQERLHPRHADMPYRSLLALMSERLWATSHDEAAGYPDAAAFLADIALIEHSLSEHAGEHAGGFAVRRLRRRAECFGFHLASLDLRQDSAMHDGALAALLDDPDWARHTVDARVAVLHGLLDGSREAVQPDAAAAASTLAVFRAVADLRPRHGERAFGPYIISMSRSAADALAVLALAGIAGCVDGEGRVPLDVAPLFETVDDLDAAADTLRALFADPVYRRHLQARGNRQVVMLGYSDSAKDGGIVASRWALQQTQIALTALAHDSGVRIAFFHGRGGSLSRGGGKTERAVIAAPRGSVDGQLRLTEQGEVIHRKYGIRALALRNLEQATGAVLRATLRPRPPEPREGRWREIAAQLADDARRHYRALVHEHPDFPAYFRAATPIDVIERLRIGSRPSKRASGGQGGVESLRAIPWVFAWSQNRAGLTAWYGVGSALETALREHGDAALAEMARDWPFFGTLIDDVEMVLAKSDMAIFERYSLLAAPLPDGDLHARLYPGIAAEFERTRKAVLAIKREDELLAGDPRLRLSIRLRNPYVDPISVLQVDLLARWRAAGRPDDDVLQALVATVNGIAAGIQNTG
ncbi:phosphoenolpyruvate carboxylase [Montanilutibacter psychrotolerans]|uniref:Phosphoenolpyruvate carboxylase n=1 Tax=Montanilutibacter psychrotolerans TaxID=1327343 RepID=A0A3M8SQA4_9GAMM|nr:phosphoenolpyruvate carboxylase [Lysobacter psychrotolerans]RNF82875.1 phosphoenolpyruvate carboxylase [Lysobacter psychrotolerans]